MLVPEEYQKLIWFVFPSEALSELMQAIRYQKKIDFEFLSEYNQRIMNSKSK